MQPTNHCRHRQRLAALLYWRIPFFPCKPRKILLLQDLIAYKSFMKLSDPTWIYYLEPPTSSSITMTTFVRLNRAQAAVCVERAKKSEIWIWHLRLANDERGFLGWIVRSWMDILQNSLILPYRFAWKKLGCAERDEKSMMVGEMNVT